jgi:hypothetical protein
MQKADAPGADPKGMWIVRTRTPGGKYIDVDYVLGKPEWADPAKRPPIKKLVDGDAWRSLAAAMKKHVAGGKA